MIIFTVAYQSMGQHGIETVSPGVVVVSDVLTQNVDVSSTRGSANVVSNFCSAGSDGTSMDISDVSLMLGAGFQASNETSVVSSLAELIDVDSNAVSSRAKLVDVDSRCCDLCSRSSDQTAKNVSQLGLAGFTVTLFYLTNI
jgi:hypothetical protein